MTTSSFDIGVNWEQLYPIRDWASLLDLEDSFTEEEIRGMVFLLGSDTAPGSDRFNMRFY